jgi:hypothetical protein
METECEHVWIENTIPGFNDEGYMILRFCHLCKDAQGYGFMNKEHEIRYLESLWNSDNMLE